MLLIGAIDVAVVVVLLYVGSRKGIEAILPLFAFVVVLVPGESVIPLPGLFTITTQRVALATLTTLYLWRRPSNTQRFRTPLGALLLVHIAWCALSTVNSVVFATSIKYLLSQVCEYYLMYFILVHAISSANTMRKILAGMVAAVFVACLCGAVEAYTDWSIVQWFPAQAHRFTMNADSVLDRGQRISSTFSHPILFGAGIAFVMVELFYLLSVTRRGSQKMFLWIATLPMFLCIYKTGSRGPWLALAAGLCIMFLCPLQGLRRRLLGIAGLVVLVLLIRPGVYDSLNAVYGGTVSNDPNSVLANSYQYRFALWRVAYHALARDPLRAVWGYGMESWYDLHLVEPFGTNPAYPFDSCDSSWVQAMAETGYVGLGLFILLLFKPAHRALVSFAKTRKSSHYLYLVLLINMIQYYFMMYSVGLYSWGQTGYMLWMWIAMVMAYRNIEQKQAKQVHSKRSLVLSEKVPVGA